MLSAGCCLTSYECSYDSLLHAGRCLTCYECSYDILLRAGRCLTCYECSYDSMGRVPGGRVSCLLGPFTEAMKVTSHDLFPGAADPHCYVNGDMGQ